MKMVVEAEAGNLPLPKDLSLISSSFFHKNLIYSVISVQI